MTTVIRRTRIRVDRRALSAREQNTCNDLQPTLREINSRSAFWHAVNNCLFITAFCDANRSDLLIGAMRLEAISFFLFPCAAAFYHQVWAIHFLHELKRSNVFIAGKPLTAFLCVTAVYIKRNKDLYRRNTDTDVIFYPVVCCLYVGDHLKMLADTYLTVTTYGRAIFIQGRIQHDWLYTHTKQVTERFEKNKNITKLCATHRGSAAPVQLWMRHCL